MPAWQIYNSDFAWVLHAAGDLWPARQCQLKETSSICSRGGGEGVCEED